MNIIKTYTDSMAKFLKLISAMLELNIDAYITPMSDEHLFEFVNSDENKIRLLTGFTGTSGMAITGIKIKNKQYNEKKINLKDFDLFRGLYTDSRYFGQASKQLKEYELIRKTEYTLDEIISEKKFKKVGIDPHFISHSEYQKLKSGLRIKGIDLIDINDPVIKIWNIKTKKRYNKIIDLEEYEFVHEVDFEKTIKLINKDIYSSSISEIVPGIPKASLIETNIVQNEDADQNIVLKKIKILVKEGQPEYSLNKSTVSIIPKKSSLITKRTNTKGVNITGSSRIEKIIKTLKKNEILIISELDTIAWIFNLRGFDIENNMLFWAFAAISKDHIKLFVDPLASKNLNLNKNNDSHSKLINVELEDYEKFYDYIERNKTRSFKISGNCMPIFPR